MKVIVQVYMKLWSNKALVFQKQESLLVLKYIIILKLLKYILYFKLIYK